MSQFFGKFSSPRLRVAGAETLLPCPPRRTSEGPAATYGVPVLFFNGVRILLSLENA